jgi:hypothetical protein
MTLEEIIECFDNIQCLVRTDHWINAPAQTEWSLKRTLDKKPLDQIIVRIIHSNGKIALFLEDQEPKEFEQFLDGLEPDEQAEFLFHINLENLVSVEGG